jgi:hypothetical protein
VGSGVGGEISESPSQPVAGHSGAVVHTCHPSDDRNLKIGLRIEVQASLGKKQEPIAKITRAKV